VLDYTELAYTLVYTFSTYIDIVLDWWSVI
jgi:hypothetical protein